MFISIDLLQGCVWAWHGHQGPPQNYLSFLAKLSGTHCWPAAEYGGAKQQPERCKVVEHFVQIAIMFPVT